MNNKIIFGPPGTGKTYRLIDIYSEVLDNVDNVAGLAFNKAVADKIAIRAEQKTGETDLRKKWICTFHGFCRRLLSQEYAIKVLPPKEVAWELLKFIRDTKKFTETKNTKEILRVLISLYEMYEELKLKKNFWLYFLGSIQNSNIERKWNVNEARKLYQNIDFFNYYPIFRDWRLLQELKLLTFSELQIFLSRNVEKFKDKFKYILLDEAQDLSPTQWNILKHFNGKKIIIGDDDQSIYSFRGASPKFFLSLPYEKEFLQKTYRYDDKYAKRLEMGMRHFLSNNRQKKDITGIGKNIKIYHYFPVNIQKGVVLARTNSVLRKLSYFFVKRNMPHILQESSLLYSRTINPFKKKFKHILIFLNSDNIETFANQLPSIIKYKNFKVLPIEEKIAIIKSKYKSYYDLFNLIKDKPLEEKIKRLQYHEKTMKQAKELVGIKNIKQFLEDIYEPKVTLSTIHRFKGREDENIYIYGFKDGLFPLKKGDWEEEVRIAYVALSRTKGSIWLDGDSEFGCMV